MRKPFITIILSLFLLLNLFGQNEISIPVENLKINYKEGQKIYINKINYFEYNQDNYLIDSTIVENQIVTFKKLNPQQEYFVLSEEKETPLTYLPLRQIREHYTSMFCSNFYAYHNYLIIDDSFDLSENEYLIDFQTRLSKKSFDQKLMRNGKFKKMSIEAAQKIVEKRKDQFLDHLNQNSQNFSEEFKDYIRTEIILGANNQFLNWYEETENNSIEKEFLKTQKSLIHEEVYNNFMKNKWNIHSIQYFRTIERILNYEESKIRNKFDTYYPDIEDRTSKQTIIIEKTADNRVSEN